MTIWKWENITRHDDQPYLTRLIVFRCWLFSLMVHWFEDGDDECLHDHPWPFMSVILKGGYWEVTDEGRKWYGAGSVLFRPATWKHRIELAPGLKAVSVVLTGRRIRSWGFFTKFGWLHHTRYSYRQHCE